MSRVITNVRMSISEEHKLKTLRFVITGGRTGRHQVAYLQGDWLCNCFGYMTHKKCRHVKAGQIMLNKLDEALGIIEEGEETNWRKQKQ